MERSDATLCHLFKWHTSDSQTTPSTHFTDSIDDAVGHVVVLTIQTTLGLGGRASDVEDAGGQVLVADLDLVSVGHGWFPCRCP